MALTAPSLAASCPPPTPIEVYAADHHILVIDMLTKNDKPVLVFVPGEPAQLCGIEYMNDGEAADLSCSGKAAHIDFTIKQDGTVSAATLDGRKLTRWCGI